MIRKTLFVGLLFAAAVAIHCGGGSRDPQVIRLADRSVPLSEIVGDYDRLNGAGAWTAATPDNRHNFVQVYARKELLVRKAREQCGPEFPAREKLLYEQWLDGREPEVYWEAVLSSTAYSSQARDSMIAVRGRQRQFSHVSGQSEADIRAIHARVLAGEDLAAVAREYEGARGISLYEGLWLDRSELPLQMGDVLFSMEQVGQLSAPFRSDRYGWHILRFDGERQIDPAKENETEEVMAARFLDGQRLRHEQEIRDKYKFELVAGNVGIVRERFAAFYDSLTGGNIKQFSADLGRLYGPVHRFTAEELALPIVTWNNGAWNIGDYVRSLSATHLFFWPGTGSEFHVGQRILRRMEQWAARQEAAASGVLEGPSFVAEKQRKRDELLLDCFYRETILTHEFNLKEEDVEAYWREHQEEYRSADEVTFGFIYFPADLKDLAGQAYTRLQAGERWEEIGAEMLAKDRRIVHQPMIAPSQKQGAAYPSIEDLALTLDVREDGSPLVSEPIEIDGDWVVLKIFARERPYVLEFAEAETRANRDLLASHMEQMLLGLLEGYEKEYRMVIDWKAIE
ncbi:MAG: peptidyl-prolyl cis-trans isomerase [Candidatus Eisenbacteria bacterium]